MKKLLIAILAFIPMLGLAQDKTVTKQLYTVHEDVVKPSMKMEYDKICTELITMMTEHNVQDAAWLTSQTNDFRYWYTSPITSLSELGTRNPFKTLTEKVGEEKMNDLWARMDKCYDKHGTYVIGLDTELSYMPTGIDQNPAGEKWREFHFWHFTPENEDAARTKAKELQQIAATKKSPIQYRVYRSGFGTVGTYYLVAFNAKNATDFAQKMEKHMEVCGPELLTKLNELRALTEKYEEVRGVIRDDLSYRPQTRVSAVKKQ